MTNMMSTAAPQATADSPTREIRVRVVLKPEHEHWSALLPEWTIAGRGDDPRAAAQNAVELLADYLQACADDGVSIDEARRPVPLRWRAEIELGLLLGRLRAKSHRPRREQAVLPHLPAAC